MSDTTLVVVGWSPWTLTLPYAQQLTRVADFFSELNRDMDVPIAVWQITPRDLDKLRGRMKWRHLKKITDLVLSSAEDLLDLEAFSTAHASKREQSDSAPTDLLGAQANLIAELARDLPRGNLSDRVRRAQEIYRQAVHHELTGPLQEWALADPDPAVRAAGMELATVCGLLHEMGPRVRVWLQEQTRKLGSPSFNDAKDGTMENYVKLSGRFSALVRDLCQLRNS